MRTKAKQIVGEGNTVNYWLPFYRGANYATNQTFYTSLHDFGATQSSFEFPFPSCKLKGMKINVSSNSANNDVTVQVMRGANVLMTVTIPALQTGIFTTTGDVQINNNDLISFKTTIPAGGSAIGIRTGMLNLKI